MLRESTAVAERAYRVDVREKGGGLVRGRGWVGMRGWKRMCNCAVRNTAENRGGRDKGGGGGRRRRRRDKGGGGGGIH